VLLATLPIKNYIRNRDFFKIITSLETGMESGMWTFQRYRSWLDKRSNFNLPPREVESADEEPAAPPPEPAPIRADHGHTSHLVRPAAVPALASTPAAPARPDSGRIEIEPTEIFEKILKRTD
jgi:hypothetical protein